MTRSLKPTQSPRAKRIEYRELPGPVACRFFLYRPTTQRPCAPVIVSVHGIARNAAAHALRFAAHAERFGAPILAPYFSKDEYGRYQQLEDRRCGARSDLALITMIEEVARATGADASRVLLFGYSGGAQFVHRFAMAHPQRVASAALASAGWYTMPDAHAPYPAGLDISGWTFERPFDASQFANVPFHVCVGELDVLRDGSLRQSKSIDRAQGLTRVERAARWTANMKDIALKTCGGAAPTMHLLTAVGHDFGASVERGGLADWLFGCFARDTALSPVCVRGEVR